MKSLEEAVRIMAAVQLNMTLSDTDLDDQSIYWSVNEKKLAVAHGRALSNQEVKDIVAFLHALEGTLPAGSRFQSLCSGNESNYF